MSAFDFCVSKFYSKFCSSFVFEGHFKKMTTAPYDDLMVFLIPQGVGIMPGIVAFFCMVGAAKCSFSDLAPNYDVNG
jgi:hypothetical protein